MSYNLNTAGLNWRPQAGSPALSNAYPAIAGIEATSQSRRAFGQYDNRANGLTAPGRWASRRSGPTRLINSGIIVVSNDITGIATWAA